MYRQLMIPAYKPVTWSLPRVFVPSVNDSVVNNAYGALYWLAGTSLLVSEILGEMGWLK